MKRIVLLGVFALLTVCLAQAQDLTGDWQGSLDTGGGALRIVLHVTKAADGSLKATMDSPDQGVAGMPVDTMTLDGGKLKLTVNVVHGSYDGKVKGNDTISGKWAQGGPAMQLEFKRTTTPIKLVHKAAPPSDIDGAWTGTIVTPSSGTLHVVFHFVNTEDGLMATMDSPDQNIKGWPATGVTRKGSAVTIEMNQVGGTFHGKISKDSNTILGDWTQGPNYPLALHRTNDKTEPAKNPGM